MTTKKKLMSVAGGLAAFALTGCGPLEEPKDVGDVSGVEEIGQPLAALATAPTFASGTLTIALAAGGETAIVSRHAVSGNILVNDVATTGATATAVKNVAITGGAGNDTVILDFANGTFAPGVTGGPGITVALAGGTNVFKLRGASATGDTITVGGTATAADIAFNIDAFKDIAVTSGSAVALTFSLGGGNDIYNALSGANGTGGAAFAVDIAFNIDAFKDIAVTSGSAVALTFSLGGGNDIYNALSGANGTGGAAFAGDATIYGGLGDDTLTGGDGDETFYGDLGNDTLNGGSSNADGDVYNGGGGSDTVTYAARSAALTITVGAGAADGETATETDDIKGDIEIVRGGTGIDTFTGHAGDQIFYGGAGDDIFLMGDTTTGAGNDTVYGEAGTDTVSYAARTGAVTATMDLNVANDGESGETDTIRDDVEKFICPTAAVVCTVTGNALDNTITGGAGADVLSGGAGDDTFIVGATGGIGAGGDTFNGGAGIDKVDFTAFGAVIAIVMDGAAGTNTQGKIVGTDVENLTCATASACVVTGNAGNNRIVGSTAVDTITTAGGDDFVETSGGNDIVDCGDGSDILYSTAGTPVPTACEL